MSDPLWLSFQNCVKGLQEAQGLEEAIERMVSDSIAPHLSAVDYDWDKVRAADDILTFYHWTYEVRERRRGNPRLGMLTFAESFWHQADEAGNDWAGAQLAKLYVAFAPPKLEWSATSLFVDGLGVSPLAHPRSEFVWQRADGAWFFCIHLLRLETRKDLEREIFAPLNAILAGESDEAAFRDCSATLRTNRPAGDVGES